MTEQGGRSVAQTRRGVVVHASPFNGVKLELALMLIVLITAWLVVESQVEDGLTQLVLLASMACTGAAWVFFRTRQVLRKSQQQMIDDNKNDGESGHGQG